MQVHGQCTQGKKPPNTQITLIQGKTVKEGKNNSISTETSQYRSCLQQHKCYLDTASPNYSGTHQYLCARPTYYCSTSPTLMDDACHTPTWSRPQTLRTTPLRKIGEGKMVFPSLIFRRGVVRRAWGCRDETNSHLGPFNRELIFHLIRYAQMTENLLKFTSAERI